MLYGFTVMIGWKEALEDVLHVSGTNEGGAGGFLKGSFLGNRKQRELAQETASKPT
jgi:hypothetical protein